MFVVCWSLGLVFACGVYLFEGLLTLILGCMIVACCLFSCLAEWILLVGLLYWYVT